MTGPSPARALALRVLARVRERDAYAAPVLDAALGKASLSAEDAALAHRLVFGSLQMQGTLDVAVDRFLERPAAVEPKVRDALRISAYELLFSRVPPHAAVSEGVELVRTARSAAAGLANAVLRRLAEAAPSFPWGDPADPAVLALETGHPEWMVRDLIARFGASSAEAVLRADNEPAPLFVAVNPFRATPEAAVASLEADGAVPVDGPLPGCLRCEDAGASARSRALTDGLVIVCDAAAQFAAAAVGAHPGGVVADIAAGRGTKTLLLQAHACAAGRAAAITALDLHEHKTRVLEERMRRLGVPGVSVVTGDATDLASVPGMLAAGTVDGVLVDAPCTGLGTLRRHPERRWRARQEDAARLAAIGSAMLASAAHLVRVGGVVVYSTCTLTAVENDDVANAFLASESGGSFRVRQLDRGLPELWRDRVAPTGWFQSLPEEGGADGHFVAAFERIA